MVFSVISFLPSSLVSTLLILGVESYICQSQNILTVSPPLSVPSEVCHTRGAHCLVDVELRLHSCSEEL